MKPFFAQAFRCFLCLCVSCWTAQLAVIVCTVALNSRVEVKTLHILAALLYALICSAALFFLSFRLGFLQDSAPVLRSLFAGAFACGIMLLLALLTSYAEFFSGGARDLIWLIARAKGTPYIDLESIPDHAVLRGMLLYFPIYIPMPLFGRLCGRAHNHAKSRRFLRQYGTKSQRQDAAAPKN